MDELVTRTARIWLAQDGIVHLQPHARHEQGLSDAIENVSAVAQVAGRVRRPLLIHFQTAAPQTPECRAYYMSDEGASAVSGVAVVTTSVLGRVVGNLMIGMNKGRYPFRLFGSETQASAWLQSLAVPPLAQKRKAPPPQLP
jgi:hypothetical protein